jgi:hypothetical protein
MNRCVMVSALFFPLKVFRDSTVGISVGHLHLKVSRKVSGVSYIVIK